MGKSGDLLRLKKQKNTVYTFTAEQLRQHDEFVLNQKRDDGFPNCCARRFEKSAMTKW